MYVLYIYIYIYISSNKEIMSSEDLHSSETR